MTLEMDLRRSPEELLAELGERARLTTYVASAPGAGKTRRLLDDGRRMRDAGRRVVIGWIETKGRPDLERMAAELARIPSRRVRIGERYFDEFDYDAALREKPDVVILDELAHENLGDGAHAKRWQDALALREAGISVIGAFNIQHLESAAPAAERIIGHPVREIIPFSFMQAADAVVALDISPRLLRSRVRSGKIVNAEDVDRALNGVFKEQTLEMLRELLLQTVDRLTLPAVKARCTSNAVAFILSATDAAPFLRRSAAVAHALDLAFEVVAAPGVDSISVERSVYEAGGELLRERCTPGPAPAQSLGAALVAVSNSKLAAQLVNEPFPCDLFIVGAGQTYIGENAARSPYSGTVGDRMRIGYGRLTVYIGPAAGAGKTYAMLDRAHQLIAENVDLVAAFIETHGRPETASLLDGLEAVPPKVVVADGITYTELDRDALIARRPAVALIDELAHTNAPGSNAPKRFQDVLAVLREGIDVVTTLNVQHLEGLADTVHRLTGTVVRETLPDGILALADEIVLVDITPDALRERLREGKIYPMERVDRALASFFRRENLFALRELALREALRSRYRERVTSPFDRLMISVGTRAIDAPMIRRASRIAARLAIEFAVAHVVPLGERPDPAVVAALRDEARRTNAEWIEDSAADVPARLLQIARMKPQTTLAVAGARRRPRWPQPAAFPRRLLDAGAQELLVLVSPSDSGPDAPD